jgi:CHAT domain
MTKIKVLFLVSNPLTQDRLALDEECRQISAKIRSSDHRDAIELIAAWAVRPADLQELLLRHRPHVVHFSGHGMPSASVVSIAPGTGSPRRDMVRADGDRAEQLVLVGEDGQHQPMSKAALVDLFSVLKDNVHLVILSACRSAPIAEALAEVIPCAIGIHAQISDAAAMTFAASFYQALGFGRNIQEAFELGKNALMNLQHVEVHSPRLYARKGATDPTQAILVAGQSVAAPSHAADIAAGSGEPMCDQRTSDNLLHIMWNSLDPNLQDAFSLAYNKKRRLGKNRISTKDFFQALVRLDDDSVSALIESLPPAALPDPIDAGVPRENRLVLEEKPLLSDCVADSLEHFKELHPLPRRITAADMFVDIARYGHGESVSRLRQHGIGKKQIEERVQELGLAILESNRR